MSTRPKANSRAKPRFLSAKRLFILLMPVALLILIAALDGLSNSSTTVVALLILGAVIAAVLAVTTLSAMSYSEERDSALRELAEGVGRRLELSGISHLAVDTAWSFGWPKIRILFADSTDLERAKSSERFDEIREYAGAAIKADAIFGRNRGKYDPKRSLWLTVPDLNVSAATPQIQSREVTEISRLSVAQIYMSIAAVGCWILFSVFKKTYLLFVALGLGTLVILLWLMKRHTEKDLYRSALRLGGAGHHLESLKLLLTAEQEWSLNTMHSTPRTVRKDFERLNAIVLALNSEARALGGELNTAELTTAIETVIEIYSDRANFSFGSHDLKATPRERVESLRQQLPRMRSQTRATCHDLWMRSDQLASRARKSDVSDAGA